MKSLAIFLILFLSKLFNINSLKVCRFAPSCTEYACSAIRTQPFLKACGLIVRRLFSCHPFHKGGYDPIYPSGATRP